MTAPGLRGLLTDVQQLDAHRSAELLAYLCGRHPDDVQAALDYLTSLRARRATQTAASAGMPEDPDHLVGRRVTRHDGVYGLPLTGQIIALLPDGRVRVAWDSISTDEHPDGLTPANPDQPAPPASPPPHPNTLAQLVDDLEAKVTAPPEPTALCQGGECRPDPATPGPTPTNRGVRVRRGDNDNSYTDVIPLCRPCAVALCYDPNLDLVPLPASAP